MENYICDISWVGGLISQAITDGFISQVISCLGGVISQVVSWGWSYTPGGLS